MRKVDTRDESTMEYALLKNKNKRKLLVSRYLMEPRNVQNSREQLFFFPFFTCGKSLFLYLLNHQDFLLFPNEIKRERENLSGFSLLTGKCVR